LPEKTCPQCKELKSRSEFYKNKANKDGLGSYCKFCWKIITAKFQKTSKGQAIQKRYYTSEQGKEKRRLREKRYLQTENGKNKKSESKKRRYYRDVEYQRLKNNSKYHKISTNILKQIKEKYPTCQMCNTDKNLSFDHKHPIKLGGKSTKENLWILCRTCNGWKSDRLFLPGGGILVG